MKCGSKKYAMGGEVKGYAKGGAVKTPDTSKGKRTSGKARGMGAATKGGSYSC